MRSDALYISQIAAIDPTLYFINKHSLDQERFCNHLQLHLFNRENRSSYLPIKLIHEGLMFLKHRMGVEHAGLEIGKHYDFQQWFYAQDLLKSNSALEVINRGNFLNNCLLTNFYSHHLVWQHNKPSIVLAVKEMHEGAQEYLLAATSIYIKAIYNLSHSDHIIDRISLPFAASSAIETYFNDFPVKEINFNSPHVVLQLNEQELLKPLDKTHIQSQMQSSPAHAQEDPMDRLCPLPIRNIDDQLAKLVNSMLLQQVPDIQTIANFSGIHPRTLQRRLQDSGCTFSSIIDRVRQQKAEHLLSDWDLKITDIAFELGYNDSAHFSRAFKRWYGLSPKQYRQRHELYR